MGARNPSFIEFYNNRDILRNCCRNGGLGRIPACLAGRALLVFRYISKKGGTLKVKSDYAELRWGKSVRWRPWLMIDVKELEELEELVNRGTDAQVESWRVSQLSVCGMIAIIGALVASAGVTALQFPGLEDCRYIARGTFVMSLILSLLSVFFSGLQQSSFGRVSDSKDLRRWLSSGTIWNAERMKNEYRSSIIAHMILQAPFEIVVMSITLFVVGFGTYLGSSWKANLKLTEGSEGNRAVLIAFIIPTVFVLLMYGHMMRLKDREPAQTVAVDDVRKMSENLKPTGSSSGDTEAATQRELSHMNCTNGVGNGGAALAELRLALKEMCESK